MGPQQTADFCVRLLYRASKDAWICGDDAEAERLAALAKETRMAFNAEIMEANIHDPKE
jgi:hypothetical protein